MAAEVAQLEARVKQMPEADRMLARHEIGLYRHIVKLRAKLEQEANPAGAQAGSASPEQGGPDRSNGQ